MQKMSGSQAMNISNEKDMANMQGMSGSQAMNKSNDNAVADMYEKLT